MAAPQPIVISDLQGGRNGVDPPISGSFPDNQAVEAANVDLSVGSIGAARAGSDSVALLGGTVFGTGIRFLCRHVPSGDEGQAELWGIDGVGVVKRLRAGTLWENVGLDDPITGDYDKVVGVSFNGKLFLFYKSAQNRLHAFDPLSGVVRRVGINPGTVAPTITNGAAGTPTGSRYYRVRFLQMDGVRCVRKSEATPASTLFGPSGAALCRVTRPAAPGERETHWEIEAASGTSGPWFVVRGIDASSTQIDIATTFYDDSTSASSFYSLAASDLAGMYALFPAARFGISDNNRLIVGGSYLPATETHESRIWFSPVLGSDDRGDDERWRDEADIKTRIDTSEKNGGSMTGLIGPVNGTFWSTKYRQLWRHTPTGDLNTPYITRQLSSIIGCVAHKGIVMAEDPDGAEVGYFPSHRGYYRVGMDGYVYMGRDVEDIWKGDNGYSRVNLAASIPIHATYHTDEAQLYVWLATGTSDTPNVRLRCDIKQVSRQPKYGLRGGWVVDTGAAASAYCSCVFANTLGASMSVALKPYIGRSDTTVYKCDSDTATTDAGTAYRSYIRTKSLVPQDQMHRLFEVKESVVIADASPNTLYQNLIGDFGRNTKVSRRPLDAEKTQTIVLVKFGASMQSEMGAIQVELGDAAETASSWTAHALIVPVAGQGTK